MFHGCSCKSWTTCWWRDSASAITSSLANWVEARLTSSTVWLCLNSASAIVAFRTESANWKAVCWANWGGTPTWIDWMDRASTKVGPCWTPWPWLETDEPWALPLRAKCHHPPTQIYQLPNQTNHLQLPMIGMDLKIVTYGLQFCDLPWIYGQTLRLMLDWDSSPGELITWPMAATAKCNSLEPLDSWFVDIAQLHSLLISSLTAPFSVELFSILLAKAIPTH